MTNKKVIPDIFDEGATGVDNAVINKETKTITFPVHWYDDAVTPESLDRHIQFIHGNMLINTICTAAVLDSELKTVSVNDLPEWKGEMDLGGIKLHARHADTHLAPSLSHEFNEEYRVLEEACREMDAERCKNLFEK